MNFATGDNVYLLDTQIVVNGTMSASGDSFSPTTATTSPASRSTPAASWLPATAPSPSLSSPWTTQRAQEHRPDQRRLQHALYVPYNDVQYLGDNATFKAVYINAGTLSSGTLALNQIGTASSLEYVFSGGSDGFTVASGRR